MKYLIVGLGNIGYEYENTRHNIGFRVLDALAKASNLVFTDGRYGATCELRLKGRVLVLLKPSTYMNLSGNAVRYWLQKENIPVENMLVVVDDLALPFGTLRLKPKGTEDDVLLETPLSGTLFTGYTRLYIPVVVSAPGCESGQIVRVKLGRYDGERVRAALC